jgi:hypothetical protein
MQDLLSCAKFGVSRFQYCQNPVERVEHMKFILSYRRLEHKRLRFGRAVFDHQEKFLLEIHSWEY